VLWRARARFVLAAGAVLTGAWTFALLRRTSSFHPWLAYVVVAAALVAAGLLLLPTARRAVLVLALACGLVGLAGGSAAYALDTAATAHTGSTPIAGPTATGSGFGGRGGAGGVRGGGGFPARAGAPPSGMTGAPPNGATGAPQAGGSSQRATGGFGGGSASVSSALVKLLQASHTTWAAATIGSQSAAPLELASGKAVMAIGGFSGSDAAPTLAQFEKYVAEGKIRYFIAGGGMGGGPGGGNGSGSAITQWAEQHFSSTTDGGTTVYDLTKATSS
jgi:4-amino-4-deoxy-L-arabinose transferase-like glycosyltransferase